MAIRKADLTEPGAVLKRAGANDGAHRKTCPGQSARSECAGANITAQRETDLAEIRTIQEPLHSALNTIIFSNYNPSGRLPISIPRSVGQIPVYYSQPITGDYVEDSSKPLFPFGYGLSYTQFEYSGLEVEDYQANDTLYKIISQVNNTGSFAGDEVVPCYIRDEGSSVAPASKLLKGFQRVSLQPGEAREVVFFITKRDLSVYDTQTGWHLEPGAFTVVVGGGDTPLEGRFFFSY